jgi:hypothetical protein
MKPIDVPKKSYEFWPTAEIVTCEIETFARTVKSSSSKYTEPSNRVKQREVDVMAIAEICDFIWTEFWRSRVP